MKPIFWGLLYCHEYKMQAIFLLPECYKLFQHPIRPEDRSHHKRFPAKEPNLHLFCNLQPTSRQELKNGWFRSLHLFRHWFLMLPTVLSVYSSKCRLPATSFWQDLYRNFAQKVSCLQIRAVWKFQQCILSDPDLLYQQGELSLQKETCLLYTSDAADEEDSVDLGGR